MVNFVFAIKEIFLCIEGKPFDVNNGNGYETSQLIEFYARNFF